MKALIIFSATLMMIVSCLDEEGMQGGALSHIGGPAPHDHDEEHVELVGDEFYYAAIKLRPVEDDSDQVRAGGRLKVAVRVLLDDGEPKIIWLHDITDIRKHWKPTKAELHEVEEHEMHPLKFEMEKRKSIESLSLMPFITGKLVYTAKNTLDQVFKLHWNEMRGGSVINDRVMDKFVVWADNKRFTSFGIDQDFHGGHLNMTTEKIVDLYFSEDASDDNQVVRDAHAKTMGEVAKHKEDDLTALCGEEVKRHTGANGFILRRRAQHGGNCSGNLTIRIAPGIYSSINEHNVTCEVEPALGIRFSKTGTKIALQEIESVDCDHKSLIIDSEWETTHASEMGMAVVNYLTFNAISGGTETEVGRIKLDMIPFAEFQSKFSR